MGYCRSCCIALRTLYRVNPDGTNKWVRNFYFDSPASIQNANPATPVYQCDSDINGNLYQTGILTQANISNRFTEQPPMYTLRSWDDDGNYRWGWSDAPTGTIVSGVRQAPRIVQYCRCGGTEDDPIVVVSDHPTLYSNVYVTGISTAGVQLWRVSFLTGSFVVDVGETRTLVATPFSEFVGPSVSVVYRLTWVDNANGASVAVIPHAVSPTSGGVIPTQLNSFILHGMIDTDDTVYTISVMVPSPPPFSTNYVFHYGVSKYPKDATTPSDTETSFNFFKHGCSGRLGSPKMLQLNDSKIFVMSNDGKGWEVFDKSTLEPDSVVCRPTNQFWRGWNFLYATEDQLAMWDEYGNIFKPPAIHNIDGSLNKIWDTSDPTNGHPIQTTPFYDAQPLADGGSVWSQNVTKFNHTLVNDTRSQSTTCPPICSQLCYECDLTGTYEDADGNPFHFWDGMQTLIGVLPRCASDTACFWQDARNSAPDGHFIDWVSPDPLTGVWPGDYINSNAINQISLSVNLVTNVATLSVRFGGSFQDGWLSGCGNLPVHQHSMNGSIGYTCPSFDPNATNTFTKTGDSMTTRYDTSFYSGCSYTGGGMWKPDVTGSTTLPSTVILTPISCEQTIDGEDVCTGSQGWQAVNVSGSLVWVAVGLNTCPPDCAPAAPVTIPITLGQVTVTTCQ